MNQTAALVRDLTVTLPPEAPLVRITAGVGSAGQKTWNLRRPITLIGSRRPAHIVLHDKNISIAHCVIVNTGSEVLIKDLRTSGGTCCNRERINLAVLKDGDVITVGETNIQVAIQVPEGANSDSGCGVKYEDPTRFLQPVTARLIHTERVWNLEEAVVMIGRHQDAIIHLDHNDVSARHAVLFRFMSGLAVFDLGSRAGLWVNGQRCSLTPLTDGDCITVGPFGISISVPVEPGTDARASTGQEVAPPAPKLPASTTASAAKGTSGSTTSAASVDEKEASVDGPDSAEDNAAAAPVVTIAGAPLPKPSRPLPEIESDMAKLHDEIGGTWEKLNSWQSRLEQDAHALNKQEVDLAARVAEVDARDAALRGQLHDITRFHEQVLEREAEISRKMAELQTKHDELKAAEKAFGEKEADIERRNGEVQRREHAIAHRWSRLQSFTCPHCNKPVSVGSIGPGETG